MDVCSVGEHILLRSHHWPDLMYPVVFRHEPNLVVWSATLSGYTTVNGFAVFGEGRTQVEALEHLTNLATLADDLKFDVVADQEALAEEEFQRADPAEEQWREEELFRRALDDPNT